MKELLQTLHDLLAEGQNAMLVRILAASGSTPRGAGAQMLVTERGRVCGSIGGGAVEHQAIQLAQELLQKRSSMVKEYHLSRDLGMICGGDVDLLYQFIAGHDAAMLELCAQMLEIAAADIDVWLITRLTGEATWQMGWASRWEVSDGLDVGISQIMSYLKPDPACYKRDEVSYYFQQFHSAARVLIFGGGHVAQALVGALAWLGFSCWVMDDRPELCEEHLFPGVAKVFCGEYEEISRYIEIRPNDYVVVMTHGHAADYLVQKQAMLASPAYIGVIGSKNKVKTITAKLLADGFSTEEIARVHSPIGLPIKAQTPREIAVSIAAQLIEARAERAQK